MSALVPTSYDTIASYAIYLKKGGKGGLADFLKKKAIGEHGGGCGCSEGTDCSENDCSCCPPGLVGVWDDAGNNLGCLTPADAELYTINTLKCQDGYVKLINNTTGQFLGCVSEAAFGDLYTQVNP